MSDNFVEKLKENIEKKYNTAEPLPKLEAELFRECIRLNNVQKQIVSDVIAAVCNKILEIYKEDTLPYNELKFAARCMADIFHCKANDLKAQATNQERLEG